MKKCNKCASKALEGYSRCLPCLHKVAKGMATLRAKRKLKGQCIDCTKPIELKLKSFCRNCRNLRNEHCRNYYRCVKLELIHT